MLQYLGVMALEVVDWDTTIARAIDTHQGGVEEALCKFYHLFCYYCTLV